MERNIEEYGNKLTIIGMVLGNGKEADVVALATIPDEVGLVEPTLEELNAIFRQLDVLDITNTQKVVLRKSQRQIDQRVAWKVFKRDGYKCVYCHDDDSPLTVDHLVLWEEGGDTVEGNLVSACRKCNHTRGNQQISEFLESAYYKKVASAISSNKADQDNNKLYILLKVKEALKLPLRPTKRSR